MHPNIYEYSEKLSSKLPGDLNVVYLVNSGSEANDLAILLARLYTKNYEIITLKNVIEIRFFTQFRLCFYNFFFLL